MRAAGGTGGEAVPAARLGSDRLWDERVQWSDQLMLQALRLAPFAAASFAWLFHHRLGTVWTIVCCAVVLALAFGGFVVRRRARSGAPWTSSVRFITIVGTAVVYSTPPWLVAIDEPGSVAMALSFPVAAAAIGVILFAAVRRWFLAYQAIVSIPTFVWILRHRDVLGSGMAAGFVGFVVLTVVLQSEVHRLVVRSLTMKLRNEALVDALRRDQERIEYTNQQLAQANDRLVHQAGHDSLTGVLNRRGLEQQLQQFMTESDLADRTIVVLFCDLDRFKVVNDSLGHAAGDQLLCTTAERIRTTLPDTALLARLGGDEFVAIVSFPHADTDPDGSAVRLADDVRSAVAQPVSFEEREFVVTTTVGVAVLDESATNTLDVLRQADRALHYAKDAGRNRVELFGDGLTHVLPPRRVDEDHNVRTAIERGDIVPWYQPIVDVRSGRVVAAELLARWIAPDGRMVRARDFIHTAHESGLIEQMSEMLLTQAVDDIRRWERSGLPVDFRVGFNLPPRFVSRTARAGSLVELLAAGPTERITVEVSEVSVVDDIAVAAGRLAELRELGLLVSLDDFGTGTASLSLLKHMPIDSVKIDRSFVMNLGPSDSRDRTLVAGFVGIARELGLGVVAEGVEELEQAECLSELSCFLHQGYLYADAVDAAEMLRLVHRERVGPVPGAA